MSLEQEKLQADNVVRALTYTIETLNPSIAGHSRRVNALACAIADELALPGEARDDLEASAWLYDIGMIAVPMAIQVKPGRLLGEEVSLLRAHPMTGYNIIQRLRLSRPVADIVLQHHERLDGSGYPGGVRGDKISLPARILGVADVVEAMASHRPYRAALGLEAALEEITRMKGVLYDPGAVEACVGLLRRKKFEFA